MVAIATETQDSRMPVANLCPHCGEKVPVKQEHMYMRTKKLTCPKCKKPLEQNSKFCANCGNDVSGVWSQNPQLGGTIAIENDPNVDVLGQMLSEATLGDYEIYGELGRGGMAAVYLGSDLALNRPGGAPALLALPNAVWLTSGNTAAVA